jgi:hypothetical protein
MAENVFILGAGASVHAGIPVMADFFDVAYDLYDEGMLEQEDKKYFENVIEAKRSLQRILANVDIDLNNIETIFSLVEMGRLINKFPGCKNIEEIKELNTSFKKFIIRTLEKSTNFIYKEDKGICPPEIYWYFIDKIISDLENKKPASSCIITFNYDIALDYALEKRFDSINYCLNNKGERKNIDENNYKLFKLHGSINWALSKKNNEVNIYPISIRDFITNENTMVSVGQILRNPNASKDSLKEIKIEIGSKINKLGWIHKPEPIEDTPLIIPPTWTKTEYQRLLSTVWMHAAKEISRAKNIFIIGYSYPETDEFFKYLLGLGMIDIVRLKGFWVFNPDKKVLDRFEKLMKKALREKFQAFPQKFESGGAMDIIENILKIRVPIKGD